MGKRTNKDKKIINRLDWKKYDKFSIEEKKALLYQLKSDIYKLEERMAEKKSIFVHVVDLIDREQGIYDKKRC